MAQINSENLVVIDKVHTSWASATTAWQQYRTTSRGKTSSSTGLDSTMHSVGDKINDAYNDLVDVLGNQFVKGDDVFESDMNDLEMHLLSQLCTSLRGLSGNPNPRPESSSDHEAETMKLVIEALARTIQILERLASRLGYKKRRSQSSPLDEDSLFDDSTGIEWCKGALLNQQSSANYKFTITQPADKQSKICKFCYLEISDYRSKAIRRTDEDWSALASCHVLACSSFRDRRAAYRCSGCYVCGISKVQASAAAMSDHIASCSEFKEKRTRAQMPTKTYGRFGYALPSPPLTPVADNSVSSAASTPSTNGNYSPGPRPDQSRSAERTPSLPLPPPARKPPPVPSTSQTGLAYPPRPDMDSSAQRIPGGFPTVQPSEPVHPNQSPIDGSASGNQDPPPHTPLRDTSTHRKAVPPPEQYATPQYPPVSSPHPKRTSWITFSRDPNPSVPRLPEQVRQLMELGASRAEAESRLRETNWNVQEAADLYLNNLTSHRK